MSKADPGIIERRLSDMGLSLPILPEYSGAFLPGVIVGNLLFMSAQAWTKDGRPVVTGTVGGTVELADAIEAARRCALNGLAAAKMILGSLDKIDRVARVVSYVRSAPGFDKQSLVVNGASQFLVDLFGEAGRHARTSVGVIELTGGAAVLIELTLQKKR
jgi:enamine deaminase RidA (YjgF/YER057c/UK114 family)